MAGITDKLNFALPDGHLMNHVLPFIEGAGIAFEGYEKENLNKRPPSMMLISENAKEAIKDPERVTVKVIRPQDMPTQVANANFDIAISGVDWLTEHKLRFPKSPIMELLPLGFGKVRIVAAVHKDKWKDDFTEFMKSFKESSNEPYLKIASEYVYIADHFAIKRNLHPYRIIMTYGATESLIPEDCDMIVENTETGNTLRKNNLEILDTIMHSEGCLIISKKSLEIPWKKDLIMGINKVFNDYLTLV